MVKRNRQQYSTVLKSIFSFPDSINEYTARIVAGIIVLLSLIYLYTDNIIVLAFLVYGFFARVIAGPSICPIAILTIKFIIPKLGNPYLGCPGPPKRFAQLIGFTITSMALYYVLIDKLIAANFIILILVIFASLESIIGFCAGCWLFKKMMKWGWIPEYICLKCHNISIK